MNIAIALLMVIHGFIHLLGYLKAFEIAKIDELKEPISKKTGIFWLVAFLLFLATAILYLTQLYAWQYTLSIGLILSQILIMSSWRDAKVGTIPNILFLALLLFSI